MKHLSTFLLLFMIFNACVDPEVELLDTQVMQMAEQEKATTLATSDLIPRIIFDTDMAEDCDDVGATAVLHALADRGEVTILGMMVSMPVQYGAPALDALNTFYKRPNIPIGTLKNSKDAIGAGNLTVFNKDLALRFPNSLKDAKNAPNSVTLYRQLLKNEKDGSVIILSVGPLTNLYHLMKSPSDNISSLNGMELIRKKVKRLFIAGGRLPQGTSYNFRLAPEKSEFVINNWPTEIAFTPNELGDNVLTGKELLSKTTRKNPVHEAYRLYRIAHPGWQFRPSWDQMGVMAAVRGKAGLFKIHSSGGVRATDATIKWHADPDKKHLWYQVNSSIEYRRRIVESLMIQAPK